MPLSNNEATPKEQAREESVEAKKRRRKQIILWIIIVLLLSLGFYYLFKFSLFSGSEDYGGTIEVNQPVETASAGASATTSEESQLSKAVAWSENFEMMQINLEGSGTNIFDFGETEILTLSDITSELYTPKANDKSEIRAIISCKTNKRSYAEVEYGKSGDKNKKIIRDDYPGFSHALVIPELDADTVYKYSIRATDLNQSTIRSEQFAFYTGAGTISLVDVLQNAVQKVFGWTMGK